MVLHPSFSLSDNISYVFSVHHNTLPLLQYSQIDWKLDEMWVCSCVVCVTADLLARKFNMADKLADTDVFAEDLQKIQKT